MARSSPPPSARSARVLVVDDVRDNREMYAEYLRFHGFEVETAASAEDALRKADRRPPSLVVMDIVLPGIDGWEAIRRLRAKARTRRARVLVVTGHSTPETQARAALEGVDAVCTKPCLPQTLLQKLNALLETRPAAV